MILAIIHGLNPNSKLRSILEGCANLRSVWSSDFKSHCRFSETFFQPDAVYIRFTHVPNLQPKFYIGSASHGVLHREHSRFRKFLQLKNDRLVQAELALRFWKRPRQSFCLVPTPAVHGTKRLPCDGVSSYSRMATEAELSFHLPILSPSKRPFEKASDEYECPIWVGNPLAPRTPPLHTEDCQGHHPF